MLSDERSTRFLNDFSGQWLEVRMDQPLARLAFYLLEPASDDGLVAWNYLDDQLKDAKTYPILRVK